MEHHVHHPGCAHLTLVTTALELTAGLHVRKLTTAAAYCQSAYLVSRTPEIQFFAKTVRINYT